MGSNIKISVIATGFDESRMKSTTFMRRNFGAYGQQSEQRVSPTNIPGLMQQAPIQRPAPQPVPQMQSTPIFSSPNISNGFTPITPQPQMNQPAPSSPASDELEDEFDIPAFLRQGK
jgi:hypothetical protein